MSEILLPEVYLATQKINEVAHEKTEPNYERNYVPGAPKDVQKPLHYNTGKIEVIDFLEDQKLEFRLANAVKYICRANHKGTKLKDLQKAVWYLMRVLKEEEAREV